MQARNMCGRMQFLLKGTMPKVLTATLQSMYEDCSDYYLTVFHNHFLTSCATPDTDIIISTASAVLHDASGLCTIHLP